MVRCVGEWLGHHTASDDARALRVPAFFRHEILSISELVCIKVLLVVRAVERIYFVR